MSSGGSFRVMGRIDAPAKAGFAAVVLVLSLLLAFGLQPSGTSQGNAVTTIVTTQVAQAGAILVQVQIQDGLGVYNPGVGVGVGITQLGPGGLRVNLQTNNTGEAWFPAPPGAYDVSLTDLRFSIHGGVDVTSGRTTEMTALANSTSYGVGFADAQETAPGGVIPAGRPIDLQLGPGVVLLSNQSGQVFLSTFFANQSGIPRFNGTVFLQGLSCCAAGFSEGLGGQVPAAVLYQGARGGVDWLEVSPNADLSVVGLSYLMVVTYTAGYSVRTI